jgi:hypothetical protein
MLNPFSTSTSQEAKRNSSEKVTNEEQSPTTKIIPQMLLSDKINRGERELTYKALLNIEVVTTL